MYAAAHLGVPDRAWMCPAGPADQEVVPTTSPNGEQIWLAVSHRAVSRVVSDPGLTRAESYQTVASWMNGGIPPEAVLALDGADHRRARSALRRAMRRRTDDRARNSVRGIIDRQIAALSAGPRPVDFVAAFAGPVAALVTADLLGVPDPDINRWRSWSEVIMSVGAFDRGQVTDALEELLRYTSRLVVQKRMYPDDGLASQLIQDEQLSRKDVLRLVSTMLAAGIDNKTSMLGHCLLELHDHPDRDWALATPDHLQSAVNEVLRSRPTGRFLFPRVANHEIEIQGVTMPERAVVVPVIGIANFDDRRFHRADAVDLRRDRNHHFTYGHGSHHCLGASLATTMLVEATAALFRELPAIRPVPGFTAEQRVGFVSDGFQRLPVTF